MKSAMDRQRRQTMDTGGTLLAARLLFSLLVTAFLQIGCGGGAALPGGDFSVSVSPTSVSALVGLTTSPVTIEVDGQNGFSGTVNVALQGVPAGVTVSPSSSFALAPGTSQFVTFNLPDSAAVGTAPITVLATSGARSHNAQIMLTAESIVRTYQSGTRLYLESGTATDTAHIGLETTWGGSIVEVSVNGTEYVNRHDTGREVQPAFRSGSDINWNPTLAGDGYDRGTPVMDQSLTAESIYIKAQPLQWSPDFYGGGPGQTVAGDMLVEQTVTAVTSSPHTFKVHYKVTHLGSDTHGTGGQEFLALYTNWDYSRFVYYNGPTPWTSGGLTVTRFPDLGMPNPPVFVPERWGALVDAQNMGLTVYAPSSGPMYIGFVSYDPTSSGGPDDNSTNYFAPLLNWTISPGFVREADIYLIVGDYNAARAIVYALHKGPPAVDIFAPYENIDQPSPGSTVSGVTTVSGWAFDDAAVSKVEILVDGAPDGVADYGQPRPDVANAYPNFAPMDVGFTYALATAKLNNGPHILSVRVTDTSNNIAISPDVAMIVAN
jgi:hypothetical protein